MPSQFTTSGGPANNHVPNTTPHHQLNLFQHIFGTSRVSEIINTGLVILGLYISFRFIVLPLARLVLEILNFRRLRNRQAVFLEITPPASSTKTPLATAQWFGGIYSLLATSTFKERLLQRKHVLPLEVVSSRDGGIRYIAQLAVEDVALFQQLVVSYLPTVWFREVSDYLPDLTQQAEVCIQEFKQTGHFAYPLASHATLNEHDPIAYITGAMAHPLPGELIALQLILSPASARAADQVRYRLMHGQDAGMQRQWWHWFFLLPWKLLQLVVAAAMSILEMLGDEAAGARTPRQQTGYTPPAISAVTNHVLPAVHDKLSQPLFNVDIRALAVGTDSGFRMQGLANSLYQFHVPGYQALISRSTFPRRWKYPYRLHAFDNRTPAMLTRNSSVFAASEVASLFHFPYGDTTSAEGMVKSLDTALAAPLAMKQHSDAHDFDVVLGVNRYHGRDTAIGLTAADRERHVYIIGGTGNGKTTMLEYAMVQDMRAGKGLAFIDPHGDAARKLLKYIPESRMQDVIYLNPIDITYPIGVNLLELPAGLDEDQLILEKDTVTEAVVSILRKVFADDDANAHRIEAMLRNAIRTAFTVPDATLFTILKLLRNTEFRNSVVAKLEDEDLKDFWREEFGQAGSMQRVSMSKGLTHRIDRFVSSAPTYRMLSQVKSTISFEDIMNDGKILICNFSTEMGEDTSALFGTMVLAKLKIAAERRAKIAEEQRRPYYVYVDEFQNFATTPFVKMLSGSRKYKLYLTIAEQSTAQQEDQKLTEAILANAHTVICFQTGSPADERLLLPRFEPYITKRDIGNLPAYHYYLKVKGVQAMEPVSGETVVLDTDEGDEARRDEVIALSRKQYARLYIKPVVVKKETKDKPTKNILRKSQRHNKKS